MKNIFVNGTAAKTGGSVTILESYLASRVSDLENYYYIFCPHLPSTLPKNAKWVKCSTGGISTLLFCIFFCFPLALHYRCSQIISFSNINTIFSVPWIVRVTYFHNMLILNGNSFKYRLLRWLSKHAFQKKVKYIFQTSYVRTEFEKTIGYCPDQKTVWPGIKLHDFDSITEVVRNFEDSTFRFLVPIMDISHPHKNYKLIQRLAANESSLLLKYSITANGKETNTADESNLHFLGKLSHTQFLNTVDEYDGVLIVSETETLCLPIFEALVRNKPVFVLEKDYLLGLEDEFGTINGLYKFNDFESLVTSVKQSLCQSESYFREEYLKGNWNF